MALARLDWQCVTNFSSIVRWFCSAYAATKLEQQVQEVAGLMLRKGLFMKTERMFKKPKPGKKRLVKWPKKLLPLHNDKVGKEEVHLTARAHRQLLIMSAQCRAASPTVTGMASAATQVDSVAGLLTASVMCADVRGGPSVRVDV